MCSLDYGYHVDDGETKLLYHCSSISWLNCGSSEVYKVDDEGSGDGVA